MKFIVKNYYTNQTIQEFNTYTEAKEYILKISRDANLGIYRYWVDENGNEAYDCSCMVFTIKAIK